MRVSVRTGACQMESNDDVHTIHTDAHSVNGPVVTSNLGLYIASNTTR